MDFSVQIPANQTLAEMDATRISNAMIHRMVARTL